MRIKLVAFETQKSISEKLSILSLDSKNLQMTLHLTFPSDSGSQTDNMSVICILKGHLWLILSVSIVKFQHKRHVCPVVYITCATLTETFTKIQK